MADAQAGRFEVLVTESLVGLTEIRKTLRASSNASLLVALKLSVSAAGERANFPRQARRYSLVIRATLTSIKDIRAIPIT